jgi:hypothetical protein
MKNFTSLAHMNTNIFVSKFTSLPLRICASLAPEQLDVFDSCSAFNRHRPMLGDYENK